MGRRTEERRGEVNTFINFSWYNFTDGNEPISLANSEKASVKIMNKNNSNKSQPTDRPCNLAYTQTCFRGSDRPGWSCMKLCMTQIL